MLILPLVGDDMLVYDYHTWLCLRVYFFLWRNKPYAARCELCCTLAYRKFTSRLCNFVLIINEVWRMCATTIYMTNLI